MVSTLVKRFKAIFDRDRLLDWARELGAVVRLRDLHPQDFCLALVSCTMGDEERSIASARRLFFHLTGTMPEESSFYDRFTCAMFLLWQRILDHAMKSCSRQRREALYLALRGTGILDILAIDASQVALPASAAEVLPSTDDGHVSSRTLLAREGLALCREGEGVVSRTGPSGELVGIEAGA